MKYKLCYREYTFGRNFHGIRICNDCYPVAQRTVNYIFELINKHSSGSHW